MRRLHAAGAARGADGCAPGGIAATSTPQYHAFLHGQYDSPHVRDVVQRICREHQEARLIALAQRADSSSGKRCARPILGPHPQERAIVDAKLLEVERLTDGSIVVV